MTSFEGIHQADHHGISLSPTNIDQKNLPGNVWIHQRSGDNVRVGHRVLWEKCHAQSCCHEVPDPILPVAAYSCIEIDVTLSAQRSDLFTHFTGQSIHVRLAVHVCQTDDILRFEPVPPWTNHHVPFTEQPLPSKGIRQTIGSRHEHSVQRPGFKRMNQT